MHLCDAKSSHDGQRNSLYLPFRSELVLISSKQGVEHGAILLTMILWLTSFLLFTQVGTARSTSLLLVLSVVVGIFAHFGIAVGAMYANFRMSWA